MWLLKAFLMLIFAIVLLIALIQLGSNISMLVKYRRLTLIYEDGEEHYVVGKDNKKIAAFLCKHFAATLFILLLLLMIGWTL